jgi:predicted transcriptional regulator
MAINDLTLMQEVCKSDNLKKLFVDDVTKNYPLKNKKDINFFFKDEFEYPLDSEIIKKISEIEKNISNEFNDYKIFEHQKDIDDLWAKLIGKSIKCLRFFDTREPYFKKGKDGKFSIISDKEPNAYGIGALTKYFEEYKKFENALYGSSEKYRDHVIHVFRTWLTGIFCLLNYNGEYIKNIFINKVDKDDKPSHYVKITHYEKLSIWTIIALTHDLGYPLERAKEILEKTRSMVSMFITNTDISMDLSFQGAQNYMNDFIVRLMSSKMEEREEFNTGVNNNKGLYFARLQPKYYFKFQKSLEKDEHGIVSTMIIYKLLSYFLESDYNINEDYQFNEEDRRQFYIRREILRSIAAHTCKDIYHMNMGSFPFLLIVADETQEWGRKYLSELYIKSEKKYKLKYLKLKVKKTKKGSNKCSICEEINILEKQKTDIIKETIENLYRKALKYVTLFRDGKDTEHRDFLFEKEYQIIYKCKPKITLKMNLIIDKDRNAEFLGEIYFYGRKREKNKGKAAFIKYFGKDFFEKLTPSKDKDKMILSKNKIKINWNMPIEARSSAADSNKSKNRLICKVTFPLLNQL